MAENIVKNRFYRILSDASNQIWDRISFWNTAEDTEANDGQSIETKVGAINGITSDLTCEDESVAVSAKAVNDSLPQFIYDDSTGEITGYTTKIGGADTVFPFSSGEIIALVCKNPSANQLIATGKSFYNPEYCVVDSGVQTNYGKTQTVTFSKKCNLLLQHMLLNNNDGSMINYVSITLNDEEILNDSVTASSGIINSHKQTKVSVNAGDILKIQYSATNVAYIGGYTVLVV